MCRFMGNDIEKLQEENLELKLNSIRDVIDATNKENKIEHQQIMDELKDILGHVKKTNGSVARVTERLAKLEKEKALRDMDFNDLKEVVEKEREETKLWRVISSNKWVLTLLIVFIYILTSDVFGGLILDLVTKIK